MSARCTGKNSNGGRCFKAAAMCSDHADNGSDVLIDWLKSHKITFAVNMIFLNHGNSMPDAYYENIKSKVDSFGKSAAKFKSSAKSRESLQNGKSSLMMNDDDLHEFFSSDMRKINSSAEVLKIPEGEPIFIFCVIQGLLNPVMCFVDSGANCWLSKEGIPETEFISVKLADGPIPLSVASGMTTRAEK